MKTKPLAALLAFNLLLLVLVGVLASQIHTRTEPSPTAQFEPPSAAATDSEEVASNPPAQSQPFHWSQIESTNYATFIANLRGIGCPEATIRDIITADVDALYASRSNSRQLNPNEIARNTNLSQPSPEVAHPTREGAQPRSHQESALLTQLLGTPTDNRASQLGPIASQLEPVASVSTVSDVPPKTPATRDTKVTMPLVFQPVNTNALDFNNGQWAVVNQIRQNFMSQIGGENQDPNTPDYRQRWQQAQPDADYQLRAELGDWAFIQYQEAMTGPVVAAP